MDVIHDDHGGKHRDDGEVGDGGAAHQAVVGVGGLGLLSSGSALHGGDVPLRKFVQLEAGGWLDFGELGEVVKNQGCFERGHSWDAHCRNLMLLGARLLFY